MNHSAVCSIGSHVHLSIPSGKKIPRVIVRLVDTHISDGDLRLFVAAAPAGCRRLVAFKLLFILKMLKFIFCL